MIELENLTKNYNDKVVVDHLNLNLHPGVITGFLGPNGAGKSTTMKMIVSLVHPTKGKVAINKKTYREIEEPIKKIGTLIEPSALDKNLTAYQQLKVIATAAGIKAERVDEMVQLTGLKTVKDDKVDSFSLGMKQRLGVASALIGDPEIIILDEPFNGLDVDGIRWLRRTFRKLADEGKVVIVSSHLMSEIQAIADRVVIIGQGKLLADMTIEEMNERSLSSYVFVKSNNKEKLKTTLEEKDAEVQANKDGLEVRNLEEQRIGELAFESNIILYALTEVHPSLEDVFTEITDGKVEFTAEGGVIDDETR
jgi:ABC-2 type transport system ATP-binding protein